MAMSVGPSSDEELETMSTINTTPLVDVMLVLLIIFLITIPVITRTVKVELPKAANIPTQTKPENITVAVDSAGNIYWNEKRVPSTNELFEYAAAAAVQDPQPEVHIRADIDTRYEAVGRVLNTMQRSAIRKVGFITEPDRGVRASAGG